MKYLHFHNISIHINVNQNRFINECARKIKAKIPESQSLRFFFVRCRRTYIHNNRKFGCSNIIFAICIVIISGAIIKVGSPQAAVNKSERLQAIQFEKLIQDDIIVDKYQERMKEIIENMKKKDDNTNSIKVIYWIRKLFLVH